MHLSDLSFLIRESLSPQLAAAVSAAAASLPNPSQAESELLKQLRRHEAVAEDHKKGEAKNIGYVKLRNPFYTRTRRRTHFICIISAVRQQACCLTASL